MTARLYTAPEVAAVLGVELDTLYRYARRGDLRALKIGKLWRFTESDVEAFIRIRRRPSLSTAHTEPTLLPELLTAAVKDPDRQGSVLCGLARVPIGQIDLLSDRLAGALLEKGTRPGERIVVILPNSVEFIVACFAIWKIRGIVVPDYVGIRPPNLRHILHDCDPVAAIVDQTVAEQLDEQLKEMGESVGGLRAVFIKDRTFALSGLESISVESLDAVLDSDSREAPELPVGASPEEVGSITYTSGSTGMPKGVMNSHESWLAGAAFTVEHGRVTTDDSIVLPLPLHHGLAFRQVLAYLRANATLILTSDIYQALKLLRERRPTALVLVPAACNILLDHFAEVLREVGAGLRYVEIGSAAMPAERLRQLQALLPSTEIQLPYGLTEARVGFLKPGSGGLLNRLAAISPGLELRVIDEQGAPVAPGKTGEILLKGKGLMTGYWGRPRSENDRLLSEGFRTGDMGRLDANGEVELLGRLDGMLKVGGRKVNPLEVEMALNRHPGVAESAVTSRPDPNGILEQQLEAHVVLRRESVVSESELLGHCRRLVEPYKVPTRIHFRASLPKSAVGKVLRNLLNADSIAVGAQSPRGEVGHESSD